MKINHVQALVIIAIVTGVSIAAGVFVYLASDDTSDDTGDAPFGIQVYSRPLVPVGNTIRTVPGQRCVFLVTVTNTGTGLAPGETVTITAASPAINVAVVNPVITAGKVAEVVITAGSSTMKKEHAITITGTSGGKTVKESVTIEVIDGEDGLEPQAREILGYFTPYLAADNAGLGITNETAWNGTVVNPGILVVTHYLFYSDNWEVYMTWHVTVPEHAWARVYLRQRFNETSASLAFEIASYFNPETPHAIDLPDWV